MIESNQTKNSEIHISQRHAFAKREYDRFSSAQKQKINIAARRLELGQEIYLIRISNRISKANLAKEIGISTRSIWKLESGQSINIDTLLRVLEYFEYQIKFDEKPSMA